MGTTTIQRGGVQMLLGLLLSAWALASYAADRRVALVIGNAAYAQGAAGQSRQRRDRDGART